MEERKTPTKKRGFFSVLNLPHFQSFHFPDLHKSPSPHLIPCRIIFIAFTRASVQFIIPHPSFSFNHPDAFETEISFGAMRWAARHHLPKPLSTPASLLLSAKASTIFTMSGMIKGITHQPKTVATPTAPIFFP